MSSGRLLFVHAHPDDETIGSGVTMAKYAAQGHQVTLVTCTLGEEGEILVPALEHLASDQDDALGPHRLGEWTDAMRELGVKDHRLLGGAERFRDSGMMGTEQNNREDSFWRADLREAADELVAVIREVRPHVLVTYDDFGGYGHPDHIQAHRVAMYATQLAAAPGYRVDLGDTWDIPKLYWTALPKSWVQSGIDAMKEVGDTGFFGFESADDIPFVVADELVSTVVDGTAFHEHKVSAMRAYPTQITTDGQFFALSNNMGLEALGLEFYRRVKGGTDEASLDEAGKETDLLAGLTL